MEKWEKEKLSYEDQVQRYSTKNWKTEILYLPYYYKQDEFMIAHHV